MSPRLILIGAGGHAKVLLDALGSRSRDVVGLLDPDPAAQGRTILGKKVLGGDDALISYAASEVALINAVGSVDEMSPRRRVFEKFTGMGYRFTNVIHPAAVIGQEVRLGQGVQIMAGAVLQPGTTLGDNTIVNTRACVDHDCRIGSHVHIAPGATLSGGVCVGDGAHIGTGAVVIQGVLVGEDSLVAAGAVVLQDVAARDRVAGVPARLMSNASFVEVEK